MVHTHPIRTVGRPSGSTLQLICLLFFATAVTTATAQVNPARDLVNPFIGTGGHGHTFPGACVPNGMVQLSPDTRPDGYMDWDGCGGYHYSDSVIHGFSHTHLSGTGVADLCDVLLTPVMGSGGMAFDGSATSSLFDHASEEASAGYYKVDLLGPPSSRADGSSVQAARPTRISGSRIRAELTASARVGMHRYTFPKGQDARIVVDLTHRDKLLGFDIRKVSDTEVVGERSSSSWAKAQRLFYCIRFSHPITDEDVMPSNLYGFGAGYHFGALDEALIVKVGISAVSIEGARKNLEAEVPHWDFDRVRGEAEAAWNAKLNKIQVEGGTRAQQRTFYTALYHSYVAPYLFNDVDGQYRGMDGLVHHADHPVYTVFSLWDTFRALHPLMTVLEPDMTRDWIKTFLLHYQQGGRLPVWELWGNETDCMIGYHSVSVIADAYTKGIRGFDTRLALEAMVASADQDHFGLKAYRERGYISSEDEPESVSRTLEYAYDDGCIARFAEAIGDRGVAERFRARARNWQNLFEPTTGFFRARRNGGFVEPFDPYEVNFHFTEANAWQYGFFVPHDMTRYLELIGGRASLTARLDALFEAAPRTTGRQQSDITGLIGQYAHGNEPSHSFAYLYAQSDRPFSLDAYVDRIMRELYADAPDGLSGNEDCGQMSAWYVWSAMGLYPTDPGTPVYTIGKPLFTKVVLNVGAKPTTITAEVHGGQSDHVEAVQWNGRETDAFRSLSHDDLVSGGSLHFDLGPRPGSSPVTTTEEVISDGGPGAVPYITARAAAFRDTLTVRLSCITPGDLFYRINGGSEQPYQGPFVLDATSEVVARAGDRTVSARFVLVPGERTLTLESTYAPQYAAGGDQSLVDGLRGGPDFRTGEWQGYEGKDLLATVDLGRPVRLKRVGLSVLQDPKSWIWYPKEVEIVTSVNGRQWSSSIVPNAVERSLDGSRTQVLWTPELLRKARYVKVIARYAGPCPEGHPGAGGTSWIFADEVVIEE
jgi:predicted alpha-1,2-mannosidase